MNPILDNPVAGCQLADDLPALEPSGRREMSVLDYFRSQVEAQPSAVAVKDCAASLTYGELERRSNLVARELRQRGIFPEEPVGVVFPASVDYVVALLGILKAGGAYLPFDPEVPIKRLHFLLHESGSRFALTQAAGLKQMLGWPGTALELSPIISQPGPESQAIQDAAPAPNHLAYIIYTSGSTGQPKGVEIEHRSLANLVQAYQSQFNLTGRDRATLVAKVAFDASVAEVWPTLCAGGCLLVPPGKSSNIQTVSLSGWRTKKSPSRLCRRAWRKFYLPARGQRKHRCGFW